MPATAIATDAVTCTGLRKSYGPVAALAGVDLTVASGSVHGLLGPNGAGKSTLLRVLFGLVRPDAGDVRVLGHDPATPVPGLAGFVEGPRFYPYLTVQKNLDLLAAYDGPPAPDRVDSALAAVGLEPLARRRVRGLSAGQRQRLGIAAALLRDPLLLVVDEPTTGLDPPGIRDLHALVRELAAAGRTVLLSSHQMGEVDALCDELTVLARGTVVHTGTVADLRAAADRPTYLLRTSDDGRVREAARAFDVEVSDAPEVSGLLVAARADDLDAYVVALGRAGVAVRELSRHDDPLQAAFLRLTA